jgi:hypothetical protein
MLLPSSQRGTTSIHGGALSDEVLRKFGESKTVAEATTAINDYLAGYVKDCQVALVIVDEFVTYPADPSDVSAEPILARELAARRARIALDDGEPVTSRLSCALAVLSEPDSAAPTYDDETFRGAQRVLTELLLEHPVLLNPRLVIPFIDPNKKPLATEKMSVFGAILFSGRAQLPSERHGIDAQRMRSFANSPHLLAPLAKKVPKTAYAPGGLMPSTKVERDGFALSKALDAVNLSAPALASMMELGRLRTGDTKWCFNSGQRRDDDVETLLYSALEERMPHAVGLVTSEFGLVRHRPDCRHLVDEVVSSGRFRGAGDANRMNLARSVQRAVLLSDLGTDRGASTVSQGIVAANARAVLSMLAELNVVATPANSEPRRAASEWLYHELVGKWTDCSREGPEAPTSPLAFATQETAFGFMTALTEAGLQVPLLGSNLTTDGKMVAQTSSYEAWSLAHTVFGSKLLMEGVIRDATARDDSSANGAAMSPEPRRRRMGV